MNDLYIVGLPLPRRTTCGRGSVVNPIFSRAWLALKWNCEHNIHVHAIEKEHARSGLIFPSLLLLIILGCFV